MFDISKAYFYITQYNQVLSVTIHGSCDVFMLLFTAFWAVIVTGFAIKNRLR